MKKFEILSFMFLMMSLSLSSQNVQERKVSMSLGSQNAFVIDVDGADKKIMESVFKNSIKEYGRLKENRKAREFYLLAVKIGPINGSSPMDVYVKFDDSKGMGSANVWMDLGGAFANSKEYEQKSTAIKNFLQDYYYDCRREVVQNELKAEEKNFDRLEKDLSRLQSKNDSYHRDIENAQQKIAEAEKNIDQNVIDQATKNVEIEDQKKVVEKVTAKLNSIGKD